MKYFQVFYKRILNRHVYEGTAYKERINTYLTSFDDSSETRKLRAL